MAQDGVILDALDRFAGLRKTRTAFGEIHARWQQAAGELRRVTAETAARRERRDYLVFCLAELSEAGLRAGESAELEATARRLHAVHELRDAALGSVAILADDAGARDVISPVVSRLVDAGRIDAELAAIATRAEDLLAALDELTADLERYSDNMNTDDGQQALIDDRLADLHRLSRKYGGSEEALLARKASIESELCQQNDDDRRLAELENRVPRLADETTTAAAALSARRREAAGTLATGATKVLHALGMPGAVLDVRIEALDAPGPTGSDRVMMCLASNLGEEAQPLRDVASGGELSRVFLAIERACAPPDSRATVVFDEVDAGVGGETATVLGRFLAEMARHEQVICITHLPQVAAVAARQMHVEKHSVDGRTLSGVRTLAPPDRVTELARMLGGPRDVTALAHAQSLLESHRQQVST